MKKWFIYCTILLATACTSTLTHTPPVALSVIPAPQEIQYLNGTFMLNEKTSWQIPAEWSTLENLLNTNIQAVAGYKLVNKHSEKNSIQLKSTRSEYPLPRVTYFIYRRKTSESREKLKPDYFTGYKPYDKY